MNLGQTTLCLTRSLRLYPFTSSSALTCPSSTCPPCHPPPSTRLSILIKNGKNELSLHCTDKISIDMSAFLIIICTLLFVFSIMEAFVFGERYAKWWFKHFSRDYKEYDLKKFRLIRGATLGIICVFFFVMGFLELKHYEIFLISALAVMLLHYYIILYRCKKTKIH